MTTNKFQTIQLQALNQKSLLRRTLIVSEEARFESEWTESIPEGTVY